MGADAPTSSAFFLFGYGRGLENINAQLDDSRRAQSYTYNAKMPQLGKVGKPKTITGPFPFGLLGNGVSDKRERPTGNPKWAPVTLPSPDVGSTLPKDRSPNQV